MRSQLANLRSLTLPFDAGSGLRIFLDGVTGTITYYDATNTIVAQQTPNQWSMGEIEAEGARLTINPFGGLRFHDAENLVSVLDQRGYTLRSSDTGLVTAEITPGSFRLIDPAGTDSIEMVTSSSGNLPSPTYRMTSTPTPGGSLPFPASPTFSAPTPLDLSLAHTAAWRRATNQSATMTPPSGWTEVTDDNYPHDVGTLQTASASLAATAGDAGVFASSRSNWDHTVGTHVVVRGGPDPAQPTVRSTSTATFATAGATATVVLSQPSGMSAGDVLIVEVALGVNGGNVPTAWETPQGFVFLGAGVSLSGTGATQSCLAVGVWAKLITANEPAVYSTKITLPTGTKLLQATGTAVQGPFLNPGGVRIFLGGNPVRMLLDEKILTANSTTLADFTDIVPGFSNLEVVIESEASGNGATTNVIVTFNGDTGSNYNHQRVTNGVALTPGTPGTAIPIGTLAGGAGTAGSRFTSSVHVYGYNSSSNPTVLGKTWRTEAATVAITEFGGQWNGASGTTIIDRITVAAQLAAASWVPGSKAQLYGY